MDTDSHELDTEMACLDLQEEDKPTDVTAMESPPSAQGTTRRSRSLRKRIPVKRIPAFDNILEKSMASISRRKSLGDDEQQIKKYYLSKQVKRLPSTLETIFEEPKQIGNNIQYTSSRKFKRILSFESGSATNSLKVKKRKMKAKLVKKHCAASKTVPMAVFLEYMKDDEEMT